MQLPNLKTLHHRMRRLSISVEVFDFSFNEIVCSCVFNPDYSTGFSITFIKKTSGELLKLPIIPGYDLQIQGRNYYKFRTFFNITGNSGKFSMKDFFNYLNINIPIVPSKNTTSKRKIISKVCNVEESEKVHFDHLINWQKVRAQNPKIKSGRTRKNLEKTKQLYPEIYEEIKNYDISVAYSATRKFNSINEIAHHIKDSID